MDNTEPRHVDRRDQGLRRQRLVTQAAAVGAAVLSLAFGWVFAQSSGAAAKEKNPAEPAAVESTGPPGAGTSPSPGKSQSKSPAPKSRASDPASAPDSPDGSEPDGNEPDEDASDPADVEPEDEDDDEGGAELAPPPAAPAPAPRQESDATTGGS